MTCTKYLEQFVDAYTGSRENLAQEIYNFIDKTQNWNLEKKMHVDWRNMTNREIIRYVIKHLPKRKIEVFKLARHFVPNTELEYYLSKNNKFYKQIKAMNLQLSPDTAEETIKNLVEMCEINYTYHIVRYRSYESYLLSDKIIDETETYIMKNEVIPFIRARLDDMSDEFKLKMLYNMKRRFHTPANFYVYIEFFKVITDDTYGYTFMNDISHLIIDELIDELFYPVCAYRLGHKNVESIKKVFPTIPKIKSLYDIARGYLDYSFV